jgi:hypothetical protein
MASVEMLRYHRAAVLAVYNAQIGDATVLISVD